MRSYDASVVVPSYNEVLGIEKLIAALAGTFSQRGIGVEIVVVDDNSPDGTGALVDSLATKYPVRCLHRAAKLGLSSAVIDGWATCASPIVGVMDADLSHDPKVAALMITSIKNGECELAIGSRYVRGGGTANWPLHRKITSRVAVALARPLTAVRDNSSGFFFCRRSVIDGVPLDPIGFKILLEVIMKGHYRTLKEVPYVFIDRTIGISKLNSGEIVNYLKQLSRFYFGRSKVKSRGKALVDTVDL